jgi:hypothetical protein
MDVMWPSGFRKKKQYTAEELISGCERAAERIKKRVAPVKSFTLLLQRERECG